MSSINIPSEFPMENATSFAHIFRNMGSVLRFITRSLFISKVSMSRIWDSGITCLKHKVRHLTFYLCRCMLRSVHPIWRRLLLQLMSLPAAIDKTRLDENCLYCSIRSKPDSHTPLQPHYPTCSFRA